MRTELGQVADVAAWPAAAVEDFVLGGGDILVLDRLPLDVVRAAVRAGRVHEYRTAFRADGVAGAVADGLAALEIDSHALHADIAALARGFLVQFRLTEANLRIEMVRSRSCPKFHCDNVHVRLVTTYYGPATEYRTGADETVHTAPLYGLVFLKGHRHPTHRDSVHHRSPEVPAGEKRLCVVIDY